MALVHFESGIGLPLSMIKLKPILTSFFALIILTSFAQDSVIVDLSEADKASLLDSLDFDSVLVYNMNVYETTGEPVQPFKDYGSRLQFFDFDISYYIGTRTFTDSSMNAEKIARAGISSIRKLNLAQTLNLVKIIEDHSTYGGQYNDCFYPRMGFTFLKEGKAVFNIHVCFECNKLRSTYVFPATKATYEVWPTHTEEVHHRYLIGFSEKGASDLKDLCHNLELLYCSD